MRNISNVYKRNLNSGSKSSIPTCLVGRTAVFLTIYLLVWACERLSGEQEGNVWRFVWGWLRFINLRRSGPRVVGHDIPSCAGIPDGAGGWRFLSMYSGPVVGLLCHPY